MRKLDGKVVATELNLVFFFSTDSGELSPDTLQVVITNCWLFI